MNPSSLLLAAWLALSPAAEPSPAEAEAIATAFAAALEADDLAAFAVAAGAYPSGPRWAGLTRVVEGIDSPAVTRVAMGELTEARGSWLLTVEVEGSGVAAGNRQPLVLPRRWSVEVTGTAGQWRLAAAEPEERRVAAATLSSIEGLEAVLRDRPELDSQRFLLELIDVAASRGAEGEAALLWARQEAQDRGLVAVECDGLAKLSRLAITRGDPGAALVLADEAVALADSSCSADAAVVASFARGIALFHLDRLGEAVADLERAGSLADVAASPELSRRGLYMASNLEYRGGDLREALALAARHDALEAHHPTLRGRFDSAVLHATIHSELGDYEVARHHQLRGLEAARAMQDWTLIAVALSWLTAGDDLEQLRGVARELEEAIGRADETAHAGLLAGLYRYLGNARLTLGELAAAEAAYLRSLAHAEEGDQAAVALARERLAELLLRDGRAAAALEHATAAVAAAAGPPGSIRVAEARAWSPLTDQGLALQALGRTAEAERAWLEAIDELETWQAGSSVQTSANASGAPSPQDPYRHLAALRLAQGRPLEAAALVERVRVRGLRDIVASGRIDLSGGLGDEERAREAELESRLVEANRALLAARPGDHAAEEQQRDDARLALRQLVNELELAHPPLARMRGGLVASKPEDWPALLPAGGAVLLLLAEDQGTFEILLKPAGDGPLAIAWNRVDLAVGELVRKVDRLTRQLETRDAGFASSARELYDLLLGPFEDELVGLSHLAVVPDKVFWQLPFSILSDRSGVPLVERMAVHRSPSIAALGRREMAARGRGLLAMGDPVVSGVTRDGVRATERGPRLGVLPEAREEVRALVGLYGEGARALVGGEAREKVLKAEASGFDVIHLATHGLIDDRAPLYSALLLAAPEGDGEDGLLEAREIAGLDLQAKLVVLSACETARGSARPGDGAVGMWWALMAAGVPTAVVSDWSVDSAATRDLMVRFHRNLVAGAAPAEALRQAQLAVRVLPGRAHPYYWAAFGVLGAGW